MFTALFMYQLFQHVVCINNYQFYLGLSNVKFDGYWISTKCSSAVLSISVPLRMLGCAKVVRDNASVTMQSQ